MKLKSLLKKCQNTNLIIQLYTVSNTNNIRFIDDFSFINLLKENEFINRKVKSFAFATDLARTQVYLSIYVEELDV